MISGILVSEDAQTGVLSTMRDRFTTQSLFGTLGFVEHSLCVGHMVTIFPLCYIRYSGLCCTTCFDSFLGVYPHLLEHGDSSPVGHHQDVSQQSNLLSRVPIMDPLSATLAVISLATAVKDMVELGQKIHESFAKVSSNFQKAQRVAEDIKEMVEEIKVFCEDHKDALDNMKDFRLALLGLLAKFQSFEESVLPLLPKTGGRRLDRLTRAWDTWRNNNNVEERILDLQSDIVKVMRRHMMKSVMRAEVRLETIHQETSRGLEVLQVVQRNVSAIAAITVPHYSYEFSGTANDAFTDNIIMFAKSTPSTSAPMLRTPNVITEEVMTTAYIKLQINSIAILVEKMSMLPTSVSDSIAPFQLASMLEHASMNITHLRHHVVRQVTTIRDLLNISSIHVISIQDGARALNELSAGLKALGMVPESILVGTWAITLARLLFYTSGKNPDCAAILALYLLNQSIGYYCSDNNTQSLQAIEEAHAITQNLRNQDSGKVHFQELYSGVLLQYAQLVNNEQSIKMSVEATQVLEDILNIRPFTQLTLHEKTEMVVQTRSALVGHLAFLVSPITAVHSYALALRTLGTYLLVDGRCHHESALDLARHAIAMHRKMVSLYGHEHKVALAFALSSLVCDGIANHIPAGELVDMADECVQLLRELAEKNPPYYAQTLVSTMWVKAVTLQNLGRDTEAIATWEEVANIASQIIQDSALYAQALGNLSDQFRRLKRHDDAVRTGTLAITTYHEAAETRAGRYFYLSRDLQQLHRYKESVEAARTSVMLYRQLAMSKPSSGPWMGDLTEGLADLAHCLAASGDYSAALIAWIESVSIPENLVHTHASQSSDAIDRYCAALDIYEYISLILKDDKECLKVCSTTAQCFLQLLEIYPQNKDITQSLLRAEFYNAYNMLRVGRLQDAEQYISNWLDKRSSKPEAISGPTNATWHAEMVRLKADALDAQGCTKQALLVIQDICVEVSVSICQPTSPVIMDLLHHEARLRVSLGDGGEALQVAEGALQRARDNKSESIIDCLVWSLHGVAFTALLLHHYHRAFEAAQEGCDILARPEGSEFDRNSEYRSFIRPSLFAILSAAEANLGKCHTALKYANRAVGLSLEIGDNKLHISITAAQRSYMETRGNLANILLATGDTAHALQICEERSVYFSKRVGTQMGEYRELAPILRMLGILCCSEGCHEEGNTAAKELSRIMKMLGSTFPSLQEQVKIRLRHQAQVPILKVLELMSQQLDCGHQTEVALLATV
ncbi:hypothetical protein D9619_004588 [Psilocybe cf. subviscida]|uniref:Uncharacterized protein n=1 Tax=Psilocybe cf. subviscida TaxID=2480587 RepID=A0A8H5BQ11_9AGAR|nr:hypothetical protein D9619_004588 [Psilocybe cf. subviscida]